jgi:hypothetical protein
MCHFTADVSQDTNSRLNVGIENNMNKFITSLACCVLAGLINVHAGKKISKFDSPGVYCKDATELTINLCVCAGASGAPAGFSVQWMTAADFAANGSVWYASDDPRLCKASFSGNAYSSQYILAPNQCCYINVGELLFDNGASAFNCGLDGLLCGTDYVFHVFAHATSTINKSDFSAATTCSTLPCYIPDPIGCTFTQGYWKTHNPTVCDVDPLSPLCIQWPVTGLILGNNVYTIPQLLAILNTPAQGNGLLTLAHQLIAAKLNISNGASDAAVAADVAAADALIGNLVVGVSYLSPGSTSALVSALTNYNEGATGPGHCQ